jgi:hypothetical protein
MKKQSALISSGGPADADQYFIPPDPTPFCFRPQYACNVLK